MNWTKFDTGAVLARGEQGRFTVILYMEGSQIEATTLRRGRLLQIQRFRWDLGSVMSFMDHVVAQEEHRWQKGN